MRGALRDEGTGPVKDTTIELVERLLASLYIPQLIRHVQILHRALIDFDVTAYVKIGTSGTGGTRDVGPRN